MRLISLLMILSMLSACSWLPSMDKVLPDKRTDYKKSESMPELEVPPDLTADAINNNMAIPNEQASLSEYQRRRRTTSTVQTQTLAAETRAGGEQWVSAAGAPAEIWPRLRTFFSNKGYGLDLNDADLGVLETTWSQPVTVNGLPNRYKYKIFSEPGPNPDVTQLVVSSERQEKIVQSDGSEAWVDRGKSPDSEKTLVGELNNFFHGASTAAYGKTGSAAATSTSGGAPSRPAAELKTSGDGSLVLSMPEEFSMAWRETQAALERAGLVVSGSDQAKGAYYITYYDPSTQKKKGWLSKLAFWKDDEPRGTPYAVSLTGVGDKTELIVVDEKGKWVSNQDAERILSSIQNQYNIR